MGKFVFEVRFEVDTRYALADDCKPDIESVQPVVEESINHGITLRTGTPKSLLEFIFRHVDELADISLYHLPALIFNSLSLDTQSFSCTTE
jgi:hypothetical protein